MTTSVIHESFRESNAIPSNTKANLFEEPLTKQDVKLIIERAFGLDTRIINYHVRTFSDEKLGFMGAHRQLVATIRKQGLSEKETVSFFLKSLPYDISEQAVFAVDSQMFPKEIGFITTILPELMIGVKDKSWAAVCYLVKNDAIVYEDLKSRNFQVKGKFLDMPELKGALFSLAKLHAASILAEKRMGKTFDDLYPQIIKEIQFAQDGTFFDWIRSGKDVSVAVAKKLGLDSDLVLKMYERVFEKSIINKNHRNVICHGDVWSYNLMFDDCKPIPKCILVDFQLVRYAPPTRDVIQLLYLTCLRDFREKHEKELVEYYHGILCEGLRENVVNIELPTFEDIWKEYDDLRLIGLVTASLYYPINLVDGKLSAELMKDNEGFNKMLFRNKVDFVLNYMDVNSKYKNVITDVIREMLEKVDML